MHTSASVLLLVSLFCGLSPAAPQHPALHKRQAQPTAQTASQASGVAEWDAFSAGANAAKPTSTPSSIDGAMSELNGIFSGRPGLGLDSITSMIQKGFVPQGGQSIQEIVAQGFSGFVVDQGNTREPEIPVYPQKAVVDAPYSLPEGVLRSIIAIPPTFTYGKKPPVILVPGTGSNGDLTFSGNFAKLFANVPYADPVRLNIPDFLLDDAQVNAEYVAYAINYISSISGKSNVSVIGWSQGNLNTQWALKYWPSTRSVVSDFIAISPDFKGTIIATIIEPLVPLLGGTAPSVLQQASTSAFIATLRFNGGGSAYVPTTSIWSITDDIVQPQEGLIASARIEDQRGVGVSNNEVQSLCAIRAAGGIYTHEGVLYNPLAFALTVDALKNPGPGNPGRIDLATTCLLLTSPGLGVEDVIATEANIPIAAIALLSYSPLKKRNSEPAIKQYALGR